MKKKVTLLIIAVLFLFSFDKTSAYAQDTVKIMSYNLLNYNGTAAKDQNFRKSIKYANPDILAVCEIISESAMNNMTTNVLNYYTPGLYSAGTFINGYDTDNAIFFKTSKFTFISNIPIMTDLRDINLFTLVHNSTKDTVRLFEVHLKASNGSSNEQQRLIEVNFMRSVTNSFPIGTEFMVLGDFNIYDSNEPAYLRLLEVELGNEGQFIDPYNLPGVWNQFSYASYHTQSTRVRSIGDGGATGGMDDRFDMILNSQAVTEDGRIKYIPSSLKPFGNDGNHYNDSINQRPNTSVPDSIADALYYGSDHLPVYALYEFNINPNSINNLSEFVPDKFKLLQNYPNPFNPKTIINYEIYHTKDFQPFVQLKIYNATGKEIRSLVNQKQTPGMYRVEFDASGFPSGNYFYRLAISGANTFSADNYSETKSMILIK